MLKEKIKNKEKIIGTHVMMNDPAAARIIALSDYDFIWVDTEHSSMSSETLLNMIFAVKSAGTSVIVRLPQDDLTATKRTLEMGPDGIIFPMVRTAEEANRLVASTLYPPYGTRGFGPMGAIDYGHKNAWDFVEKSRDELCRFIQIEHKDAIDNLDEIIKNPYIDGYIFGPNDLAFSYGIVGGATSPEMFKIMKTATEKLRRAGKYVGLSSGAYTDDAFLLWEKLGVDMLSAAAEFDFIRDGAIDLRKRLEKFHK